MVALVAVNEWGDGGERVVLFWDGLFSRVIR